MLPNEDETVRLAKGVVHLSAGRIVEIEETDDIINADLGGHDYLITPGFIDTHVHLPQFACIGAHGMNLLEWLKEVVYPEEGKWENIDYAHECAIRALRSMISHGTTGFAAYATVHHEGACIALEHASKYRMRAMIGQVLMDTNSPATLQREKSKLLNDTHTLLERWKPEFSRDAEFDHRVSAIITPRYALSCTMALMKELSKLAEESSASVQTHLAEMRSECNSVVSMHGVSDYTAVYERAGLLGEYSLFGHGIWLQEQELKMLADSKSVIAHCPLANSFLRSGTMDRIKLRNAGVRIALGSDIGAGYETSMVRVGRAMLEAAFYVNGEAPTVPHAWWQITEGNAQALGWKRAGAIRADFEADILLVRPDIPWRESNYPLGSLLFGWDDRWIESVMLRGIKSNVI